MQWVQAVAEATDAEPSWSVALAVLAGLVGAAPLAVWVSSELDRRSELRQLERWNEVAGTASPGSAAQTAVQEAIDQMALRMSLRKLAPPCGTLTYFGALGFIGAAALVVVVQVSKATGSLPDDSIQGYTTFAFWLYVLGLVCVIARYNIRHAWVISEHPKRTGQVYPFTGDWKSVFRS